MEPFWLPDTRGNALGESDVEELSKEVRLELGAERLPSRSASLLAFCCAVNADKSLSTVVLRSIAGQSGNRNDLSSVTSWEGSFSIESASITLSVACPDGYRIFGSGFLNWSGSWPGPASSSSPPTENFTLPRPRPGLPSEILPGLLVSLLDGSPLETGPVSGDVVPATLSMRSDSTILTFGYSMGICQASCHVFLQPLPVKKAGNCWTKMIEVMTKESETWLGRSPPMTEV